MSDDKDSKPLPSSGWAKLDAGIIYSSVWQLDHDAFRVWMFFVSQCNSLGMLRASVPGIASINRVSLERAEEILAILEAPDPYSRTPDNEGRRIRRIDGGSWVVLNYLKIRELTQRKTGSHAERQARYEQRKRERAVFTGESVSPDAPPSDVTQRQRQRQRQKQGKKLLPETKPSGALAEFDELWSACLKKVSKGDARRAYLRLRAAGAMPDLATVKAALLRMQATAQWSDAGRRHQPYLATWLNAEGWEDQLLESKHGQGASSTNGKGSGLEVARRALIDKAFAECAAGRLSESNRDRIDGLATAARSRADLESIAWE